MLSHKLLLQTLGSAACGAFFQKALVLNHLKSIDFFSFLRVRKKPKLVPFSLLFYFFHLVSF